MRKLILSLFLLINGLLIYSQSFYFMVPNTSFQAEPGTGFDTRLYVGFNNPDHSQVILSAHTPQGIVAIFQPDTLFENDTVVLSIIVTDSNLVGNQYCVDVKAMDSISTILKMIHINVTNYWGHFPPYPAITYRDQAIAYLQNQHPDIITDHGNMLNYNWAGFWEFPPLLVVSNYVFLTNNWRCNVLWHNTIPPYNWKKVFIYNDIENVCWGVMIDTDGNFTEIPCQKFYYFYQDSIPLSVNNDLVSSDEISCYPNPFTNYTTITIPNPGKDGISLSIFNSYGQLVTEITNIRESEIRLENLNWHSGVYFFRLQKEGILLGQGKIIKCKE